MVGLLKNYRKSVFSENKQGHFENMPPLGTKEPYEVMYTVNMFKIFASYHPFWAPIFAH